jgi:hypothetical protein
MQSVDIQVIPKKNQKLLHPIGKKIDKEEMVRIKKRVHYYVWHSY